MLLYALESTNAPRRGWFGHLKKWPVGKQSDAVSIGG
jgi:hypothetical protein